MDADSVPQIAYWRGRPITELSREELIEVVHALGRELQSSRDMLRSRLEIFDLRRRRSQNDEGRHEGALSS